MSNCLYHLLRSILVNFDGFILEDPCYYSVRFRLLMVLKVHEYCHYSMVNDGGFMIVTLYIIDPPLCWDAFMVGLYNGVTFALKVWFSCPLDLYSQSSKKVAAYFNKAVYPRLKGKCQDMIFFSKWIYLLYILKQGKSQGFDSCDRPSNLKLDSNRQFFRPCDREIWWMTSKKIWHFFYTTSSFVHHFKSIGEFELDLQSRNAQLRSKLVIC